MAEGYKRFTPEERKRILEAPLPKVGTHAGRTFAGTTIDSSPLPTRGKRRLVALLVDWYEPTYRGEQ